MPSAFQMEKDEMIVRSRFVTTAQHRHIHTPTSAQWVSWYAWTNEFKLSVSVTDFYALSIQCNDFYVVFEFGSCIRVDAMTKLNATLPGDCLPSRLDLEKVLHVKFAYKTICVVHKFVRQIRLFLWNSQWDIFGQQFPANVVRSVLKTAYQHPNGDFSYCLFASDDIVEMIRNSVPEDRRKFLMNATFKICPHGVFKPILIIHAAYLDKVNHDPW